MSEETELRDIKELFAETVTDILEEIGVSRANFEDDDIMAMVRVYAVGDFMNCYDEFMEFVTNGDDKRAMTLGEIRRSRGLWRAAS